LLVHETARTWQLALTLETPATLWRFGLAIGVTLCLPLWRWRPVWACGLGALGVAVQVIWCFPFVANHLFVEGLALGLLALAGPDRGLGLVGTRWVAVAVMGWSGVQKLLHGTWFGGGFLASAIAMKGTFADAFSFLLPAPEVARLVALGQPDPNNGPWELRSAAGLILANGTWVVEIGLALLLLWPPSRRHAAWAGIGLVLSVQVAAREFFFAGLMTVLLLGWQDPRFLRRLAPILVAVDLTLIASLAGWLPAWTFN
jgi:hypothetical protein